MNSSWRRLLQAAAILETVLLVAAAISHLDREAAVVAAIMGAVTVGLFRMANRLVVLIASLLFANVAFWMTTATVSNLATREGIAIIQLPLALAVTSIIGLIAAATFLVRKRAPGGTAAMGVVTVAIVIFALLTGVAIVRGSDQQAQHPGDIVLRMHNTSFSTRSITAHGGTVSLYVINEDLFWHTVTIDSLGIDLKVPVGSHRRVTVNAPSGAYTFYCRIPGHAQAGMRGTIVMS